MAREALKAMLPDNLVGWQQFSDSEKGRGTSRRRFKSCNATFKRMSIEKFNQMLHQAIASYLEDEWEERKVLYSLIVHPLKEKRGFIVNMPEGEREEKEK